METMRLEQAIERFLARYDNAETARTYQQTLLHFADGFGCQRPLHTFTECDLDAWDEQLRERGVANATLTSHRRRMKAFWNWCVERDYVENSPARFLQVKKKRRSLASKAMPSNVIKAMLKAVQHKREPLAALRDTAILGLMVTYGARRGDAAHLRLNAVNLRDGWIVMNTKGDNDLRLPLPPEMAYHLQRWIAVRDELPANHNFVFTVVRVGPDGMYPPINVNSVSTMIKRLSEEVSGTQYGPHSIRHWFGQHHADNRIPPSLLRDLMGHSDVTITLDHYYNQDFERMKAVLDQTEMARDLDQNTGIEQDRRKPRIVHVDFSHRAG